MSLRHFPCTLLLLVIYGTVEILSLYFPPMTGLMICSGAGLTGFITSNVFIYIFRKYIPDELEKDIEASGKRFN